MNGSELTNLGIGSSFLYGVLLMKAPDLTHGCCWFCLNGVSGQME